MNNNENKYLINLEKHKGSEHTVASCRLPTGRAFLFYQHLSVDTSMSSLAHSSVSTTVLHNISSVHDTVYSKYH